MLCKTPIQPQFDYVCPVWYPNVNEKLHHISEKKFRLINWLPTNKRVDQCLNIVTYNSVNNICLYYLNKIFEFAPHHRIKKRNNFFKLKNLYIGPSIWNGVKWKCVSENVYLHVYMFVCPWVCVHVHMHIY